ncbi:hypothetical protein NA57DRAFT_61610 [Rhizodiscina lignyota]|uniref:Uncharacterized protein n=1 Tax=Rhizodiscina lignyota TaxID=1504668 RepID=A0A9P4I694_9PEZI|nr:hypothetical protein NA57DRAFT_61610 [Rhizodiscina lignyota]
MTFLQSSTDPYFIGYYLGENEQESFTALETFYCTSGATYQSAPSQYACCPPNTGTCYVPTACVGFSGLLYNFNGNPSSFICPTPYACATRTVFEAYPTISPLIDVLCMAEGDPPTLFRNVPRQNTATTTSSPSSISSPTSILASTSTSSNLVSHRFSSSSSSSSLPSMSSAPAPEVQPHSASKAWIAGAVVGPIAAIAIVCLALWIWHRKKKPPRVLNPEATPAGKTGVVAYYNDSQHSRPS